MSQQFYEVVMTGLSDGDVIVVGKAKLFLDRDVYRGYIFEVEAVAVDGVFCYLHTEEAQYHGRHRLGS